jgi:hypothetical protein
MSERPDRPEDLSLPRNGTYVRERVRAAIDSMSDVAEELKSELRQRPDDFLDLRLQRTEHPYGTRIGSLRYVIRNDHLKLVTLLGPVASALAQSVATTNVTPWPFVAATLIAVADLGVTLKNKSVELEAQDFHVLMTLKQLQPATREDLCFALNGMKITGPDVMTEDVLDGILNRLGAIRLRDGSIEALVVKGADERWSVNGV